VFDVIGVRLLRILGFPVPTTKKQAEEPLDMSERKEKMQGGNSSSSDAQRMEGKTGKASGSAIFPALLPWTRTCVSNSGSRNRTALSPSGDVGRKKMNQKLQGYNEN